MKPKLNAQDRARRIKRYHRETDDLERRIEGFRYDNPPDGPADKLLTEAVNALVEVRIKLKDAAMFEAWDGLVPDDVE